MVDALAEQDYIAKKPEEITIKKGDIIKEVTRKSHGWLEGIHNDKKGLFPEHCVTMLNKDSGVVLRNKHHTGRQCKVIYSYNQDHNDELNLKIGDIIDILGEEEEGWWRGLLNGKEGVFPSNFVQEIVPTKSKSKRSSREDLSSDFIEHESRCPILPPKPAKTFCEVKYAYKAQNEDELTLKENDIITLISKEAADPGWWKGELYGKIGVFPDNFVEILPASPTMDRDSTTSLPPTRPDTLPDVTGLRQQQHGMNASQRTSLHESRIANDAAQDAKNPPVPSKKPFVPVKKSPSGSGGIFSGLRKKLENIDKKDSVDGGVASKGSAKYEVKHKQDENQNAFDQVERNSLLKDVRAGRARPPVRRPPTVATKDDNSDSADQENAQDEIKSESKSESSDEIVEIKPHVREWEKHKAPWLEEMKMNQAKRSSTSPGPEVRKPIVEPEDVKPHVAPVPVKKDSPDSPVDMSKSMPNIQRIKSPAAPQEPVAFKATAAKPLLKTAEHLTSNHVENHNKVDARAAGDSMVNNIEGFVTVKQYAELWHRVEALEVLLDRQNGVVEQLRGKLSEEADRRALLESRLEKMSQCMEV